MLSRINVSSWCHDLIQVYERLWIRWWYIRNICHLPNHSESSSDFTIIVISALCMSSLRYFVSSNIQSFVHWLQYGDVTQLHSCTINITMLLNNIFKRSTSNRTWSGWSIWLEKLVVWYSYFGLELVWTLHWIHMTRYAAQLLSLNYLGCIASLNLYGTMDLADSVGIGVNSRRLGRHKIGASMMFVPISSMMFVPIYVLYQYQSADWQYSTASHISFPNTHIGFVVVFPFSMYC